MLKKAALLFGVVLLAVGVLGFVGPLAPKNSEGMPLLLGLFMVGVLHNLIHVLSGVAALVGSTTESYAKTYFQVFGLVYAVVAVVGFVQGNTVLGLIPVNMADNLLHTAIAVSALALGFGGMSKATAKS